MWRVTVEHSGSALHVPGSWLHWLPLPSYMGDAVSVSWLVIILLAALAWLGTRKMKEVPTGLQNFLEMVVEGLGKFTKSLIGPEGENFIPFIATLFIYISVMNIFGLIPGFISPTATLNMTVALALVVFLATHFHGVRRQGTLRYLKHFVAGTEGLPIIAAIPLGALLFMVHSIGELARPLSLSVRLFCNIFAEDQLILQFGLLAVLLSSSLSRLASAPALGFLPLPLQVPNMAFSIFVSLVQALIFSVLAATYIAMATHLEEEH